MKRKEPMSKSRARRIAIQTLKQRDLDWKKALEDGHAFELNEDCIRAHVLSMLGMLGEVDDLPTVLQARIVWEEMQEGATGVVHPNVAEARKRVKVLTEKVETSDEETNLKVEIDDGAIS